MSESNVKDNPLRAEKRRKLHALKEKGLNAFPYSFDRSAMVLALKQEFDPITTSGQKHDSKLFKIAGRLMAMRQMGKASFFNVQDQSGTLQCYIKPEELNPKAQEFFNHIDLGDIVGIEGYMFRTQKGELSLHVKDFSILTKTIEPLPEKFHGIADVEIKYRHRHLDLISDSDSRKVFETRARILREIRKWMEARGFMEVETPVLQPIYGGASAHPFSTHHRALDMKLYMKISPELYLKRLIVGGFEKVFEIGKNFRNEGIDRTHNPEFTMMEWYEAYTDYNYQLKQFEELVHHLAVTITGSSQVQYQNHLINFAPPWRRLTVYDGVREYANLDAVKATDDEIFAALKKNGSDLKKKLSRGEMIMALFELTAESHLIQPTFVMDHPVEISPLTKIHREHSELVERFEPFVAGMEIGNAYSELNDPEEQLQRLKDQEAKRADNEEAHPMDEDFVFAIDSGMPPTGGVGLGIERVVMLLTNQASIRDIILFPTMKHQK